MSATIDERVVEMKFNNKDFEQNAKVSMNTIERLKQALNFSASSSGLDNVAQAAKRVDMNSLGNAVDSVKVKFSALQLAAITALQNIVNRAMNAGAQLAKSITVAPIADGFNEYELKLGSIQTILANTSGQSAQVSQDAINQVNAAADQAVARSEQLNQQAIANLQARQQQEAKAIDKSYQAQSKALDKTQKAQSKALDKRQKEQLEKIQETEEKKQKQLQKLQEKELKTLNNQYTKEYKALAKKEESEITLLKKNHQKKLEMYEEEYMKKLKAADEERYNQIKAIDAQIDSINGLTEAEREAKKQAEQQEKLAQLQTKVNEAETAEERKEAEKDLADYRAELEQERVEKEREKQIEALEKQKDVINETYEAKKESLAKEYKDNVEHEKKKNEKETKDLAKTQEKRRKILDKEYEKELKALEKKQQKEDEALKKKQKKELEALNERQQNEKEALSERQQNEREALSERQQAAKEALSARQTAGMNALNASHQQALANIESEKNAKIKALRAEAEANVKTTTLEDVNKALNELNEYADKTIYNFADMTRNIGTFTAAGVDLETSVDAIKGIANLAAMSGTNANQASMAMYQLSQAIASGTVRYEDWKSVTTAGMGGKTFQNALIETARVHGVAVDEMITKNGSFLLSLQEGWLSSEVLLETLSKFTGDMTDEELRALGYSEEQIASIQKTAQTAVESATKVRTWTQLLGTMRESIGSGWAETFEIIFGNFEEATELWTGINDVVGVAIDKQADARNELLRGWKEAGGRDALIKAFGNLWKGVESFIKPIQKAFRNIFPPTTSNQLADLTKKFQAMTSKFKLSGTASKNLQKTFSGLFAVVDIGIKMVGGFFKLLSPLIGVVKDLADWVLNLTGGWGDWVTGLDKVLDKTDVFNALASTMADAMKSAYEAIKNFFKEIVGVPDFSSLTGLKDTLLSGVEAFFSWVAGIKNVKDESTKFTESIGLLKSSAETALGGISGVFETVRDKIGEAFTNLKNFVDGIKEFVSSNFKIPSVAKAMSEDGEEITERKNPFTGIVDALKSVVSGIKDVIKGGADKIHNFFKSIGDGVTNAYTTISKIGSKFKDAIKKIKDAINGFFKSASKIFTYDNMSKAIGLTQKGALSAIGFSVAGFIKNLSKNLKNLTEAIKGIGSLGDLFKNLLDPVKGPVTEMCKAIKESVVSTFGAISKEINSKALMNVAKAIAVLATSLLVLSLIPTDKLIAAGIAIGTLFADLTISMKALSKSLSGAEGEANSIKGISSTMIGISAAVLILAVAVKKISSADLPNMALASAVIVGLLEEMGRVMRKFDETSGDPKKFKKSATVMLSLAASILIMSKAVSKLGQLSVSELAKGGIAVGGLIAMVSVLQKYSEKSNFSASTGVGILGLATSMLIFQKAVSKFAELDVNQLTQGALAVGTLIGFLTAFEAIAGKAEHGFGSSVGTIAVATSLIVLLKPLKEMGNLPFGTLIQGLGGIGIALAEFAVSAKLMEGSEKSSLGMLAISAALLVLTPVLAALSALGLPALTVALTGLAAAFTVIGVASKLITPYVGTFVKLAGGIALLGAAVAGIGVGVLAFSAGLATLAASGAASAVALVAIVKTITIGVLETINESLPLIVETIKNLILALLAAIVEIIPQVASSLYEIIAQTLSYMAQYIPNLVSIAMEFLTNVINAIGERLPELVTACVNLIVTFFASITEALKNMETGTLQDALLGAGILGALFVAMAGLSTIAAPAMAGIAEAGVMIAELTALLTAIGAIAQIPGLQWLVGEGGDLLQSIGTAIGQFVGGILGGFLEGASSTLPTVGSNLTDFMTNMQGFLNGLNGINESKLSAVTNLLSIVTAMSESEEFIKSGDLGTTLNAFADQMVAFGPKVKEFADSVSGIDSAAITAAANSAKIMTEVATNLPKTGGFWQSLVGESTTLSTFAKQLKAFGPAIKSYSDTVSGGIDESAVTTSANAAKIMSEVANNLPKTGGYWQKFFGGAISLSDFGAQLEIFGPAIKSYSDTVSGGIDESAVTASTNAAKAIAGLATNLPKSGGFLNDFFGEQNLETFGTQLESFGTSLKKYSDEITDGKGISENAVTASANAGKALADLADNLPKKKGAFAFFTGENDIESFGTQIKKFGEGFKGYYDAIKGIDTSYLSNVIKAIKDIIDIADDTKDLDTSGFKSFSKNLKKMADNGISAFIQAFKDCQKDVATAIDGLITYVKSKLEEKKDALSEKGKEIGKKVGSGIKSGITEKEDTVTTAAAKLASAALTAISEKVSSERIKKIANKVPSNLSSGMITDDNLTKIAKSGAKIGSKIKSSITDVLTKKSLETIGSNISVGIRNGMVTKENDPIYAASAAATTLATRIRNNIVNGLSYDGFVIVGKNIGTGLYNGMINKLQLVSSGATKLAQAANNSITNTTQVQSPSKFTDKVGQYIGMGLANGMIKKTKEVADAGKSLGENAINPVQLAIQKIEGVSDDMSDFTPTITPVLDLSKVSSGADQINGMFQGFSLNTSSNLAQSAYATRQQAQTVSNTEDEETIRKQFSLQMDKMLGELRTIVGDKVPSNVFNITSTDPKGAAEEINQILQHQLQRRKAAWGK